MGKEVPTVASNEQTYPANLNRWRQLVSECETLLDGADTSADAKLVATAILATGETIANVLDQIRYQARQGTPPQRGQQ
jgi:hypothetical protein